MDDMLKPELTQIEGLPEGFAGIEARDLNTLLPGPALIHLPGRVEQPLFISVLLHGNEPTGLLAIQALLRKYAGRELPRPLSLFVGNVEAARQGLRRLNDQPDFNRVWPGTEQSESRESRIASQVVEEMRKRGVFASVDIHNNTGLNPHYACINTLDNRFLYLATLFGRLVVHFIRPKGVQSAAFAKLCPAVTLECGKPGQQYGVERVQAYLESCLHLGEIPAHPVPLHDIDLFHTIAQVTVREQSSFSFRDPDCDFLLDAGIDHMNFTEIPAGTVFGRVNSDGRMPVIARDEAGQDRTADFFRIENGRLVLSKGGMPSMLTLDEQVIRQDCLCYLMERISP